MYPMFNVQRPSPSGLVSTALGGAQSAFHVPGASAPNSPPMATITMDPASPLVAQHAAFLTLQAAAVVQAQAEAAAAAAAAAVASTASQFSLPSSPNATASIGGVLLPLASPRERLPSQQQQSQAQLSPVSISGDRSAKRASGSSVSSPASVHPADTLSPGLCAICGDRATGKHYGANSCDGCKGFFRRTIRKRQTYLCRFNRSCVIDKDKRNTCRYCRFKKCVEAGMRREAVQNERDRISTRRSRRETSTGDENSMTEVAAAVVASPPPSQPSIGTAATTNTLSMLLQAETSALQMRSTLIAASASPSSPTTSSDKKLDLPLTAQQLQQQQRVATINDLSEAIKNQLLLLVEWAKMIPPFYGLPLDDQVALLRAYAAQHLLLGVARRSLPYKDVLLLSNDACIPRSHSSELHDVNHVIVRLLDELVEPMREIQLDDTEYACVKALLFFSPNAHGLHRKNDVKQTRQRVLEALHAYDNDKPGAEKLRFGNILLLLPPLQAMSQQFIEDLQLATLFGMARFDKLLEELLLAAAEPLSAPFIVDGISSVANKVAGGLLDLVHGPGSCDDAKPPPSSSS